MEAHLLTDSQNSCLWGHFVSPLYVVRDSRCSEMEVHAYAHQEPLQGCMLDCVG